MSDSILKLKDIIFNSDNIVFFGGAGVSTESGIPDFRSVDGLYSQKFEYPPEKILSGSFFHSHTDYFYKFYREKLMFPDAQPNGCHKKLAELEAAGKVKAVITQNVDGLHQLAGSKNVLELHGSAQRNFCQKCKRFYDFDYIRFGEGVPTCTCGGIIKPDVVLYEEMLNQDTMSKATEYIYHADVLIIGGTSLSVYPAAGLVQYYQGNKLVLINRDDTAYDKNCTLHIRDKIGEVFSQI